MVNNSDTTLAGVPLTRGFVASRALLRGIPTAVLFLVAATVLGRLEFVPSGTSNRVVDYCIAVLLIPVVLAAILCAVATVRLTLLACWPGHTGVFAYPDALVLRLGPYGTHRYDARRLDVRYPFERSPDSGDDTFETLLPEETQLVQLLPTIVHPDAPEPLDRRIQRFTGRSDTDLAERLRPALDHYRRHESARGDGPPSGT